MVRELRELGAIHSDSVAAAVSTVPRHLFAPGEPLDTVYAATRSIVTKRNEHGAAISSLSESHIQATMLEQAQIEPGMRVLEIGTGGYNAALIAELVGESGQVTSVDIDPDIVDRARSCLAAAGYDQVNVVLADAEHGVPDRAPFDRVIVTAAAWDIPPAWTDQLAGDGRIVVPLRMRGLTRSVSLERGEHHLVSRDYKLCGFVPMQGASAHSERVIPLDEGKVTLQIDGDQPVDSDRLRDALFSPRVERRVCTFRAGEPLHDLDMWVITVVDDFGLLKATEEAIDSELVSKTTRLGGRAVIAGGSFAYRAFPQPIDGSRTKFQFRIYGHGPGGERLAEEYVDLIQAWDRDHRGGSGARITVYPADTPNSQLPEGRVIDKKHTRVVISWP
ncbi:MAG TPA: methyltransferase, FxLD system [Pseudonocardiaceae bacterium]|jgi:protein-L-isoaspartate(D-aspartate) O-methyltransferase|nr:methyltransferase, FxLD system [Pseudonocardiaceae bacterium]